MMKNATLGKYSFNNVGYGFPMKADALQEWVHHSHPRLNARIDSGSCIKFNGNIR